MRQLTDRDDRAPDQPSLRWRLMLSNFGLATFFLVFLAANVSSFVDQPRLSIALLVVFQTTIVTLAVIRREVESADRRLIAFVAGWAGTALPLLLRPDATADDLLLGQVLQSAGIVLQLVAVLSLGRSFGVVAANRGIKTGGAYRIVRHPIYAAYLVADVGFLLSNRTLLNVVAIVLATAFQVVRIWFEERHLLAEPEYAEYAKRQRWRLVPGIW